MLGLLDMKATHQRVLEALHYDPEAGVFTWLIRRHNGLRPGDLAGCPTSEGYRKIVLDRHQYREHHLAWFYVTGQWPVYELDHIDGNPLNNRFANLRDEPPSVNQRNKVAPNKNNTSGYLGVSWNQGGWAAFITVSGKSLYLGKFTTREAASAAYWAAKAEHHGEEAYGVRLAHEENQ